jgi:hypothetical protein
MHFVYRFTENPTMRSMPVFRRREFNCKIDIIGLRSGWTHENHIFTELLTLKMAIRSMLEEVFNMAIYKADPYDKISGLLTGPRTGKECFLPPQRAKDLNFERWQQHLLIMALTDKNFTLGGKIQIQINITEAPKRDEGSEARLPEHRNDRIGGTDSPIILTAN